MLHLQTIPRNFAVANHTQFFSCLEHGEYYLNLNNIINKGKVPSRAAVTSLVKRAITRQAASCWYSA